MKTGQLLWYAVLSVLFCIVLFSAGAFAWTKGRKWDKDTPFRLNDTSGLEASNRLRKIWPRLKKENIRRIILLGDSEPVEIPQECLEGYIELLDKAIRQLKIKDVMDIRQGLRIKIITDRNEYFIPGEWMISGECIDTTTHIELWNYLEGCEAWMWTDFGGYLTKYDTSGWTKCHSPRKIWPTLKKENIRRIIFCQTGGYNKADEWDVDFEVPQNCLEGTIGLLDKAIYKPKTYTGGWNLEFLWMKIITDKWKYLTPLKWSDDNIICGTDWASRELAEYLTQCEPNVSGQSASYKTAKPNEVPKDRQQYWEWLAKYNTPFYCSALTKDLKGKEIEAIVFTTGRSAPKDPNLEKAGRVGIIGDPNVVNQILGKKIEYDVVFRNPILVLSAVEAFIKAGEEGNDGELMGLDAPRFVFLTREKAYIVRWRRQKDFVIGFDFKSQKLKKDLRGVFRTAEAVYVEDAFAALSPSFLQNHYKKEAEKELKGQKQNREANQPEGKISE